MIIDAIKRAYAQLEEKGWYKLYWAIDLHGTCFKSNYEKGKYEWINPQVVPTLLQIQKQQTSRIILWSSCYPGEQRKIEEFFAEYGIFIDYFNENSSELNTETGCFDDKFYFNILLDDKAGFDPETDWKLIYKYLTT